MSIASEITSIGENLKKDYQSIANLGADLTNVDKNIENISSLLDGVYDVLPKTSFQEGTEVTLSNTLKGKLDYAKEFQEVEYIESTGTQYIDTGYIANNNTSEISVKFNATHTQNNGGFVFGGEVGFNTYACHLYNSSSKLDIGFGTYELTDISCDANVLYEIIIQKGKYIVNGNEYTAPRLTGDIQTNNSIYLFALNRGSGAILNANDQIRMYHFAIKENNVLVRDMVPCYRKSDGVIGMYDKVQDKFYTNIGTSTFTKGADVGSGFGDIVGFGQASQESTQGYNIAEVNTNAFSLEDNLISTNRKNGVFLFNGVSLKANTTYYLKFVLLQRPTQSASFTGYIDGTYETSIGVDNIQDPSNFNLGQVYTKTYIPTSNCTLSVRLWGNANNETIKLQYWVTTDNSKDSYEPYTNGASPSPNWEQEVKCVRGKNKWGGFTPFTKTQGGLTFTTNTDGSIDISGTATEICTSSTVAEAIANNLFIKLEKGTYTVSGGGSNHVIQIYDKNANIIANTQLGTTSVTFTLTQTTEIMCRVFIDSGGIQFNTKAQVQLEERKCSYFLSTI